MNTTLLASQETAASLHGLENVPLPAQSSRQTVAKNPVDSIFECVVPIQYLRTESGLDQLPSVAEKTNPAEAPFRRRCKKKVIPKPVEFYCMEVDFFDYYWNLEEKTMKWKLVLQRFAQRLQEVPIKGVLKKGSSRKPVKKAVKFVSVTPLEPVVQKEDPTQDMEGTPFQPDGIPDSSSTRFDNVTADSYVSYSCWHWTLTFFAAQF